MYCRFEVVQDWRMFDDGNGRRKRPEDCETKTVYVDGNGRTECDSFWAAAAASRRAPLEKATDIRSEGTSPYFCSRLGCA